MIIEMISIHQLLLSIIMSQRKPNQSSKDYSGTPTKVANYSPARHPTRSPLTASKFNASNSKPNVSYGELQIVLENIHEIRKKATLQINHLTDDNHRLRQELARVQQDYDDLSGRLNRSSTTKNQFEFKVLEQLEIAENDKRALEIQLKAKAKTELDFQDNVRELQREISERNERISDLQGKVDELNSKWRWAFFILAGDAQRSEELIWKVKNQFTSGIWGIFEQNSDLAQQLQLKTGKLQVIQRQLAEMKNTSKHTAALLQKSMTEVTSLNLKISQQEQELAAFKEKCMMTENELISKEKDHRLMQAQFEHSKTQYENAIGRLEGKIVAFGRQKQADQRGFAEKMANLESIIHQKQLQMVEKQKHEEYQALISQICEESQDYSQLLQRLRYLQKFKAEHYFNVEKIQFLCKMLDY